MREQGKNAEEIKNKLGLPSTHAYNQVLIVIAGMEEQNALMKEPDVKKGVEHLRGLMEKWKSHPFGWQEVHR
eukprot:5993137-Karenia_brevis.AAC.1